MNDLQVMKNKDQLCNHPMWHITKIKQESNLSQAECCMPVAANEKPVWFNT